jgi:phosphoserine phosphatase
MTWKCPRILFLDMEGTLLQKDIRLDDGLVAPSAWTVLADRLGTACLQDEQETKHRWKTGGYTGYLQWMHATVEIHRKHGLRRSIFEAVVDSIPFMPNIDPVISEMHRRGAISVLVTGGFKALADRVQRRLRLHHAFAGCEYFFAEDTGLIEHVNLLPADETGKADFMRLICREHGVNAADCAFVGDGMNDVHLANEVGFSIAFNAQQELRDAASYVIHQPADKQDFVAVLHALIEHYDPESQ